MAFMFHHKKGVSEMVGYALLVALALSIALLVYAWLKAYTPGNVENCPEDIALILADVVCNPSSKLINITLQNKGLFNVNGFYLKASNTSGIPIYNLKNVSGANDEIFLKGVVRTGAFKSNDLQLHILNYSYIKLITAIEIEPFVTNDQNEDILCSKAAITEPVNCG